MWFYLAVLNIHTLPDNACVKTVVGFLTIYKHFLFYYITKLALKPAGVKYFTHSTTHQDTDLVNYQSEPICKFTNAFNDMFRTLKVFKDIKFPKSVKRGGIKTVVLKLFGLFQYQILGLSKKSTSILCKFSCKQFWSKHRKFCKLEQRNFVLNLWKI